MSSSSTNISNPHINNSSFSSSLLEQIYRSFDDHKMNNNNITSYGNNRCILDHWIETNTHQLEQLRRNAISDHRRKGNYYSSSTSSSDSSSGIGGFSSSDTESLGVYPQKTKEKPPLKPIRTGFNSTETHRKAYSDDFPTKKKINNNNNKEGNLQRRALKLYGDLKKVKQPISPGGKLAGFLNSLFNAGRRAQSPSLSSTGRDSVATPSTASRSCLSKTPSSAGKFERRSVRFVDDSDEGYVRGRKGDVSKCDSSIWTRDEIAKELLKNYQNKMSDDGRKIKTNYIINNDNEEDEDEDDVSSCSSSDLFELENFLEIGVSNGYNEELPVFETTNLVHTNISYC